MTAYKEGVLMRAVTALAPYAKNPRTHSAEQIEQICKSIKEFGWTMPILVDENDGIIAGHGRFEAARKLGIEEVPVVVAGGWSEAQKRAYVIADNKLTENGGWDDELLKAELLALQAADFNVGLTGFDEKELVVFFAGTGEGEGEPPESNYSEQYGVIVLCRDEAEQKATYEALQADGRNCRVVTT